MRAIDEAYPADLRRQGLGGIAEVMVLVDEKGGVVEARLRRQTGWPALDELALTMARGFRYSPAKNGDEVVPVWISTPIVFDPD